MAECQQTAEPTAATEKSETDDKQFRCIICIGHYRNPRYLPTCGHTFCESCLLKYTRNIQQEGQGSRSKFNCPVCRKPNNLPECDEVTLQWVQTFPLNTVIIRMMESLPQSSEEMKEERRICTPCQQDGEINEGLKFCLDCKEVLCKTCTKYHKNFKMSKDHRLIDVGDITAEKSHVDFFTDVGKCTEHAERDVEIYCKTHDSVVCALCLISDHKTCEMIDIACYNIDATQLRNDSEMLISRMKAAIEHCNVLHKMRAENKNNLKQKLKEIRENIKQVRDQVVELMNNVVSHVSDVTKQIEIEKEDGLDAEIAGVTKIRELTEQNVAHLNTIEQYGSDKHKFVSAHLMKKMFEETSKQISDEDERLKQIDAKLVIADNLKKLIESPDVKKLVQIKVTESGSRHTPLASVLTQPRDTGAVANVLRDSKLVMVEEHKVRPDAGYEPWYNGVAMCRDGRVILTDGSSVREGGRNYVCLYNPANRTMQKLNLSSRPFSAAQIDETHLAVSSPGNKTITIVSVDNKLRVEKILQTQYNPLSIVALNTGQLAVAWTNPAAVSVVDISGTEIVEKSYLDQDINGRKFKSFWYLAVDERRQHVIQSCHEDTAVHCFDFKGNPVFKYSHPRLTDPRGVALDKCGNIYVCECNSPGSIHKLSPTGDPISVITEGVPPGPHAICSDVTSTGFWFTQASRPFDKVVYFRLQ